MGFSTPCQIHQLGHDVLCINNFLSCQLHIFFNKIFFASNIQRGNRTCQLTCCFYHSHFLTFIIHGDIGTPLCKYNLGHPLSLDKACIIWKFISIHTWEHRVIVCPTLSTIILKSWWVAEELNWERTHSRSFFLDWAWMKQLFPNPKVVPH